MSISRSTYFDDRRWDALVELLDAQCCTPLTREPLDADQAVPLSAAFKALGIPYVCACSP